ncbi:hypothetical protein COUCH_10225 [Couchioplanes caeruleus]|uniref:hypothetical protein n=1 Tax=Couchioplanes caeruleus TaxID=56438 RepID=UPI0020BF1A70|nr:hypothetical protein [Couchioplanes caeruleus]UQU66609.1 hypothetical protein COUCH_10225 [Couchioplanes caeruleus]
MTAPANDALLITLLAVFTACAGYAAGRLHQWYRTGLDRDEAYRDGYDTATRSVFSMAARLIGPRRAIRGTAVVTSATITPAVITTAGVTAGADQSPLSASSFDPASAGDRTSSAGSPSRPERSSPAVVLPAGVITSEDDDASSDGGSGGRHLVPDELVSAPTYRLPPDRVARAKVRQAPAAGDQEQETTRLPSVPRPRSS